MSSVEGAFIILDRATGPMRRMEAQAQRTDRAIRDLGDTLDNVGTRQQGRQMEASEQHVRALGRSSSTSSRDVDRLGVAMNRTDRHSGRLGDKLRSVGGALIGLQKIMGLLKFPAMIAGIGLLVKWVGALVGGLTALLPKIADLAGAVGVLPATFTGLALAMGTVKLAFSDLSKAMGGNKKALQGLTPEARQFMDTLKSFHPVVQRLRQAAQRGLFPGLDRSLQNLKAGVPLAERLLNRMGRTLGRQADLLTGSLMRPGRRQDLGILGDQGIRIVGRLGAGIRHLASAFIDMGVAARPFTEWVSKGILHFTKWVQEASKARRESGEWGRFFDRTRSALTRFGSILGHVWMTFRNIGRAARPLGDDLWRSADRAAKRWEQWTGSVTGQNTLREFFSNIKVTIHETFGLVGDLGKAIFNMSNDPSMGGLIHKLRGLVPVLESIFEGATKAFGPAMIEGLAQIGELLNSLPWSPVKVVLDLFTTLLRQINTLIDTIPGLGMVFSGALVFVALRKFTMALGGMAAGWGVAAKAALGYGVAARTAVGATGVMRPGVGPQSPMLVPPVLGGVAGGAGGAAGARSTYGALRGVGFSRGQALRQAIPVGLRNLAANPMAGMALGGAAMVGGSMLSGGAPGSTKSVAQGALTMGGMGAMVGGEIGGLPGAAIGGAGGAAIGALLASLARPSNTELQARQDAATTAAIGTTPTGLGALRRSLALRPGRVIGAETALDTGTGDTLAERRYALTRPVQREAVMAKASLDHEDPEKAAARLHSSIKTIDLEIARRKELIRQLQAEKDQRAERRAEKVVPRLGAAFDVLRGQGKSPVQALKGTTGQMLDQLGHLNKAGQMKLENTYAAWAKVMVAKGALPKKATRDMIDRILSDYRRMHRGVIIFNDRIYKNSKTAWQNISTAISDPAQRASDLARDSFSKLQRAAINALTQMGYSKHEAGQIVLAGERGGRAASGAVRGQIDVQNTRSQDLVSGARARGGRIRGHGLQDNVMLSPGTLAAPGELVVNRHTEGRINRLLRGHGTSLDREVGREGLPHSAPAFDRKAYERREGKTPFHTAAYGETFLAGRKAAPKAASTTSGRPGLHEGISQAVGAVMQRFPGLQITSTTGGDHVAGSYHYRGEAADLGADAGTMNAASSWIRSSGLYKSLVEGIHNPNLSVHAGRLVDPSFYASVWAGHADHIHLAVAGALRAYARGAGGGGAGGVVPGINLKAPRSKLGGVPGVLADRALQVMYHGMNRRVNRLIGAGGAGGSYHGPLNRNFGEGSNTTLGAGQVARLAERAGLPGITFAQIAKGESGFRPGAVGHDPGGTSGLGLWQITTGFNDDIIKRFGGREAMFNPWVNAEAAKAIYDRAGIHAWYGTRYMTSPNAHYSGGPVKLAQGGRVPEWGGWFGDGGTLTAHRPTILGVGERGTETVTVNKGGGKPVQIGRIVIHNRREGDIRRQIEREVAQAFSGLSRELDIGPLEDEAEVMD